MRVNSFLFFPMSSRNSILNQRKDIWENFPVSLKPLGRGADGAERHAVVWNRKNISAMRSKIPNVENWIHCEKNIQTTLMNALKSNPRWVVEPSYTAQQICILRMVFGESKNDTIQQSADTTPVLTRLNDINKFFPAAIWHEQFQVQSSDRKVYSIELSCKKLKELSRIVGKDIAGEQTNKLMDALRASTAWRVLPALNAHELCWIEFQ